MAEHTPGPWYVDKRNDKGPKGNLLIRDGDFHTLAEIVLRDPPGQDLANGELMTAAPELLTSLQERLDCKHCHGTGTVYMQDGPNDAHGEACDCDIAARQLIDRIKA